MCILSISLEDAKLWQLTQQMTSSTERHLKDVRIIAIETPWSPVERNAKFFTWAGMTPCIPTCWDTKSRFWDTESGFQTEWADHALTPQGSCVLHYIRSSMAGRSRKILFPGAWHWWGCIGHAVQSGTWTLQRNGRKLECPVEIYHSDQKWSEGQRHGARLARVCWGMLEQVKGRLIKQPAAAWRVITSTADPRFPQQHQMI